MGEVLSARRLRRRMEHHQRLLLDGFSEGTTIVTSVPIGLGIHLSFEAHLPFATARADSRHAQQPMLLGMSRGTGQCQSGSMLEKELA